jgi:primosomal protein N' (replication factor Y)
MLGYPPFADLIRVVCTSEAPYPAMEAVESIAAAVRPRAPAVDRFAAARSAEPLPPTQLLGPAPLFRLRGRERFQLVVKTTERATAVAAVGAAVEAAATRKEFRDVTFSVDVDPQ